ncbi:TrmH family RNA methyltransferase [Paenimyroides aestuarii]|uniref:RNA methyltransferase n=1 Tax=Paenimyroides aestuarii TaxID=2968490 RepID=A0ABY5NRL5_9FLAO|nr:RNA methyltransferase [Paenimyroides aestuarii]UUV21122.1 RNA methyltransferase [Paenimyroides aestuarii]
MKQITSIHNQLVKDILQLQEKSKARKKTQLFVIEGKREIEIALKNAYKIDQLLICFDLFNETQFLDFKKMFTNETQFIELSKEVYQKIAYRESTEGVIAIAQAKTHTLQDLQLPKNPLIVVLESLEKPGNLGAVLRTADAAKIDAVLIADPKTDVYNPNIVRSSVGALFSNQIAVGTSTQIISYLKDKNIALFSAILQEAVPYYSVDFCQPSAIVMGTEATGLSQEWRKQATANIIIPMQGQIDSMNVSVAAAVLIFEAKRQRNQ